jgi:hypothetical protein
METVDRQFVKAVRVSEEEKKSMEEEAKAVDRSVGSYLRWLHTTYVDSKKED